LLRSFFRTRAHTIGIGDVSFRRRCYASSLVVFITAVLVGFPSCDESLWLDELHTTWTIAGTIGDVLERARLGNQQPGYFWALWGWQSLLGSNEVTLRLSSLFCLATAAGWITFAVAKHTESLVCGLTSGLYLALDRNAIIFGTELRPYAGVIFTTAVACIIANCLWNVHPNRRNWLWPMLIGTIACGALLQMTSLAYSIWIPIVLGVRWKMRMRAKRWHFAYVDGVSLMIIIAAAIAITPAHVMDIWSRRGMWSGFGTAQTLNQLWNRWPWLWVGITPIGIMLLTLWTSANPNRWRRYTFPVTLILIVFVATAGCWAISYHQMAPIWHQRYVIAGLPMLALSCGSVLRLAKTSGTWRTAQLVAATSILLGVLVTQGTIQRWQRGESQLNSRGEDWRGAVGFLSQQSSPDDIFLLDAGLIEQIAWHPGLTGNEPLTPEQATYLTYPVRSIYQLDANSSWSPIPSDFSTLDAIANVNRTQRKWLLTRKNLASIQRYLTSFGANDPNRAWRSDAKLYPFGRLVLVQLANIDTRDAP
jgi:hypothetical protein